MFYIFILTFFLIYLYIFFLLFSYLFACNCTMGHQVGMSLSLLIVIAQVLVSACAATMQVVKDLRQYIPCPTVF